ncbi:hypothetical protein [Bacteriophage sp.]|nr:hypothetical protein [Bacteriophage sp.]
MRPRDASGHRPGWRIAREGVNRPFEPFSVRVDRIVAGPTIVAQNAFKSVDCYTFNQLPFPRENAAISCHSPLSGIPPLSHRSNSFCLSRFFFP